MEPAIDTSKKKAPRRALLVYCVVVFLLAWWPWNVWLIVGAAYASRLNSRNGRRLFTSNPRQSPIGGTQRIEQGLISGDCLDAPRNGARVMGYKHFRNTAG